MTEPAISDVQSLRELYGDPDERVLKKVVSRLDERYTRFIAASPFLVLGTAGADGTADVSPRGDAPGFVAILDPKTVLIPDRPGNNRLDSLRNIMENPDVALLFFIPGLNETLRINGKAHLTTDPELLDGSSQSSFELSIS